MAVDLKILITGAKGFIAKNLIATLKTKKNNQILKFDKDTPIEMLDDYCQRADFVFHLAGINRPNEEKEYMEGNFGFTLNLLEKLKQNKNTCPIVLSSSIQAILDNSYGKSKKAGEDLLFEYEQKTGAKVLVYRFPNVFGKWSRPNYNSVIATFCYNIANDLPLTVNDADVRLNLVYIDDLVKELMNAMSGKENKKGKFCEVSTVYTKRLGEIVDLIRYYKKSREDLTLSDMSDEFNKKLYSTYLSFLSEDDFRYPLKMNIDERGSFTELLKLANHGQVSINISKKGVVKGNHWHHTKNEKFIVVSGRGVIRFRKIDSEKIFEYNVDSEKLEVVDIPVGYVHNIENLGDCDMVTIMWANEIFSKDSSDTYYEEV